VELAPVPIYRKIGLIGGVVFFALILVFPAPEGMTPEGRKAAAVTTLMAVWWITEALPLAATALVPIALFPLMGILPGTEVTRAYGDSNIYLFAGGFFIAMAMQKWNLHERIALNIVLRTGTNPSRLVLGFLCGGAFLSMWMSNTATTLMMLPIAAAIVDQMRRRQYPGAENFATALMLSIAYAAAFGGMATLVGTPPNGVLLTQYRALYPDAPPIGFLQWMILGLPVGLVFIPICWFLLTRVLFNFRVLDFPAARDQIEGRLLELGRMNRGERVVFAVWSVTALLWIFSDPIEMGAVRVPGWTELFDNPRYLNHGTVAIAATIVLFLTPVDWKRGEFALDWEWARRIPWDVLILFGGGIAMADAFRSTGLTEWLGGKLTMLEGAPPLLIVLTICTLLTFLTEITSNTATATIMLPILGGPAAQALGVHPLLLMLPATLSISCAFMLPVATPPNAIVFGGGHVTVPQMARAGFLLNLTGIVLVTAAVYLIGIPLFGITMDSLPAWASPATSP
jgi:sodium-dependent dicarboxylate transporter 2/3/5